VESIPEPVSIIPQVEETPPDIERKKRGVLYVRVLAAVGIGLTLVFLWQVLTKL